MTIRKAFGTQTEALGDRQVRVRISTGDVDRAGEVVVQAGLDIGPFVANPVVLWQHDPAQVIGRASNVQLKGGIWEADVDFVPAGISAKADEICGLVKSGFINTVSIGFGPVETEPMNAAQPRGALRYLKSELFEFSFVSVPANRGATVTQRAHSAAAGRPCVKSLYDVGQLAYLLSSLGWLQEEVAWEAEFEGDGSRVPAMLGEAMQQLGATLIAMTAEEVDELLARLPDGGEPEIVLTDDWVMASATPAVRRFRAGWLRVKAAPAAPLPPAALNAAVDKAAPATPDAPELGVALATFRGVVEKAGRVISTANEIELKSARDLIDGVLAQVDGGAGADPMTDEAVTKAASDAAAHRVREAEALALAIV